MSLVINQIDNNNISIKYKYETEKELDLYLDDLSWLLYGCSIHSITFLDGNKTNFSKKNILINP
jgi:hypothetical protein